MSLTANKTNKANFKASFVLEPDLKKLNKV